MKSDRKGTDITIEEAIKDIKENIQPSAGGKSLEIAIASLEEKRKQELKGEKEMKIREAIEMFEKENELLGESEPGIVERNNLAIAAFRGERLTCTEINIEEAIEGFKIDNALLCEKQADIITRNNLAIEYLERNNEVEEC